MALRHSRRSRSQGRRPLQRWLLRRLSPHTTTTRPRAASSSKTLPQQLEIQGGTPDQGSPPDGGGASSHNPQPALGPLTASQLSEGPASPEDIPTEDAAPPGGHHVPSSGEKPTSPAEAAEPAIPGGF